ncbi:hypothetical protein VNO78_10057 [Psophocarpus tetragonolobus]|uniref:Gnk2-homologous domain-containing protein n=1 Tax=Psophocarpus tetragonolobus TaxID=3891 RepID=A0AAN9SK52_PSOTE
MAEANMHLLMILFIVAVVRESKAGMESFIFGGCSQGKFTPGSAYENSVNALLTSVVNSAALANYNNLSVQVQGNSDTVYGLFQCRGDLNNEQCSRCVGRAITQLTTLCFASCGAALQLEGCLVKYDNVSFIGVEDKTLITKKCGTGASTSDALSQRDAVLAYLQTWDGPGPGPYRITRFRDFQGLAQCTGDLTPSQCQDCLSDSIQRLKTDCAPSPSAEIYLSKCYSRYSQLSSLNHDDSSHNDDEIEKTLAILIGLIAGVALIIVFLSFLSKVCEKHKGGK